ncbi:Hypothetical predicted protein [Pelobates cultripes]|uniref:Uncharacterized protein n=1 Tax=Pelobates cultripes TaxID=61616 RepID=A0AAD1T4U9_PELCU|nr:Hypothetical predicted protein [Pelobates cultripes]
MVRNMKLLTQGGSPRRQTGTMDDFVSTPGTCSGSGPADNMVPGSPEAPQQMVPKKTPWRSSPPAIKQQKKRN